MHKVILDNTNAISCHDAKIITLHLNDAEYELLAQKLKENKWDDDAWPLWQMMKSDICTKHHYNTIWKNFINISKIKVII